MIAWLRGRVNWLIQPSYKIVIIPTTKGSTMRAILDDEPFFPSFELILPDLP